MRSSKYPLESWKSPLPFWYSTPCQISDGTAPELKFSDCCSRSTLNWRHYQNFLFGRVLSDLSVATRCSASRVYAHIHNLITDLQILLLIEFPIKILSKFTPYGRVPFPPNIGSLSLKTWVICRFDQVIPMLFLVSRILAQSTKIWRHCIIAFLHCTISYASSHKHQLRSAVLTLSKSVGIQYPLIVSVITLLLLLDFVGLS
jgi:hypothetical protein